MSILRNLKEEKIELQVNGKRILIGGREYDVPHLIAIGISELKLEMKEGKLLLKGRFNDVPLLERPSPDVLKVRILGTELPSERYALPTFEKRESKLDNMFMSFEEDGKYVIMKLGESDYIQLHSLKVSSFTRTSINLILIPYIVGALWFEGPLKVSLKESRENLEITLIRLGS